MQEMQEMQQMQQRVYASHPGTVSECVYMCGIFSVVYRIYNFSRLPLLLEFSSRI